MPDNNLNVNIKTNVELNSLREFNRAIKEQKDVIIELRNKFGDLHPAVKKAEEGLRDLQNKLVETKGHLKEVGVTAKMSSAQLLEMGENITVLIAGIEHAIGKIVDFAKELGEMALEGAEVANMREHFDKMNGGITMATEKFELLKKASSGNLDDKALLMFINKMDELGYTTDQSTQFLDIATTKHHELGLNIDEVNSKLLRFLQTGATRGLVQLGMSAGDVSNKIKEMTGFTLAQVKAMDSETATRIRSEAVLSLYGKSIDGINSKEKNTADTLKSVTTAFENAKIKIGEFISGTIGKLADAFGLTNEKMATVITIAGFVVGSIMAISAAVIGLTIAFSALNVVSGGILIALGLVVTAVATFGAIKMSGGAKDTIEEYAKLASETKNLKEEITSLKDAYDILNTPLALNEDETKKLTQTKTELLQKYPELIGNVNSETTSLDINSDALKTMIDAKETLLRLKVQELTLQAEVTISQNYEKYTEAVKSTTEAEAMLSAQQEQRAKWEMEIQKLNADSTMDTERKNSMLKRAQSELENVSQAELKWLKIIREGRATILQTEDAYKQMIKANMDAGISLDKMRIDFINAGGSAQKFGSLMYDVAASTGNGIKISKEHLGDYAKWLVTYMGMLANMQASFKSYTDKGLEIPENVMQSWQGEIQRQLALTKDWQTSDNKGGTNTGKNRGSDTAKEEKEVLDVIQKTEKEIKGLNSEMELLVKNQGESIKGMKAYTDILDKRIEKEKELVNLKLPSFTSKKIDITSDVPEVKGQEHKGYEKDLKYLDIAEKKAQTLQQAFLSASSSVGNFFGAIAGGQAVGESFKNLLKTLLTTLINYIQTQFLASQASMFFKAIFTAGMSLTSDMLWSALGFGALEALKGMIGSFATGGYVSGAGTGTSDSIPAMLSNGEFVLKASAVQSIGIPKLNAMNNGSQNAVNSFSNMGSYSNKNVNNNSVYIGSSIDGVQFFKINEPKYRAYKSSKRVN